MDPETNGYSRGALVPAAAGRFPWPAEHGAWALLLVPYWTGVAVAGSFSVGVVGVVFACAALVLLLLAKRPLFLGFRRSGSGINKVRGLALLGAALALLAFAVRTFDISESLRWTAVGIVVGLAVVIMELTRGRRDILRETASAPLLAVSAPFGLWIAGGRVAPDGILVWLFLSLAMAGLVLYARTRITVGGADTRFRKSRDARRLILACRTYHAALVPVILVPGLLGWWSPYAALAFLPISLQGVLVRGSQRKEMKVSRLGIIQTVQAALFASLLFLMK